MIYKLFFGRHIDLDKIVSISDAYNFHQHGWNVGFEIDCQLLDKPIIYQRQFQNETEQRWISDENESPSSATGIHLVLSDGSLISENAVIRPAIYAQHQFMAEKNLQIQIDEVVSVWKMFKKEGKDFTELHIEMMKREAEINKMLEEQKQKRIEALANKNTSILV